MIKKGALLLLQQMKYFVAVVGCNSLSEAAGQCHISQLAISQPIQALGKRAGGAAPSGNRRFSLTPAGEYFYRQSRVLLIEMAFNACYHNFITYPSIETEVYDMTAETIQMILNFRDRRNWKQFHSPKDLALSIVLEAAELLEVFQWSGSDLDCTDKQDQIAEELADVLNYCALMADRCGLDLDEIVQKKIRLNEEKYPADKAYGKREKYTEYQK